jgi:hypothetical protein
MDILALALNFIGTIILAFSTGKFFKWISLCLNAHEISIQTMQSNGNVLNLSGTTKHLDDTLKKSGIWMVVGVLFLIAGFGIQLFLTIMKNA